eukprot:gene17717-biopygen3410
MLADCQPAWRTWRTWRTGLADLVDCGWRTWRTRKANLADLADRIGGLGLLGGLRPALADSGGLTGGLGRCSFRDVPGAEPMEMTYLALFSRLGLVRRRDGRNNQFSSVSSVSLPQHEDHNRSVCFLPTPRQAHNISVSQLVFSTFRLSDCGRSWRTRVRRLADLADWWFGELGGLGGLGLADSADSADLADSSWRPWRTLAALADLADSAGGLGGLWRTFWRTWRTWWTVVWRTWRTEGLGGHGGLSSGGRGGLGGLRADTAPFCPCSPSLCAASLPPRRMTRRTNSGNDTISLRSSSNSSRIAPTRAPALGMSSASSRISSSPRSMSPLPSSSA